MGDTVVFLGDMQKEEKNSIRTLWLDRKCRWTIKKEVQGILKAAAGDRFLFMI